MSINYTPFTKSKNVGKGASDTNTVLIVVALVITILLGAFMWFLIIQKQREEKNAQVKFEQQSKLKIAEQAWLDSLPAATPSAKTSITPTKAQVAVTPAGQSPLGGVVASPSALPTSGQATITP